MKCKIIFFTLKFSTLTISDNLFTIWAVNSTLLWFWIYTSWYTALMLLKNKFGSTIFTYTPILFFSTFFIKMIIFLVCTISILFTSHFFANYQHILLNSLTLLLGTLKITFSSASISSKNLLISCYSCLKSMFTLLYKSSKYDSK